jgi:hypothetical protein
LAREQEQQRAAQAEEKRRKQEAEQAVLAFLQAAWNADRKQETSSRSSESTDVPGDAE